MATAVAVQVPVKEAQPTFGAAFAANLCSIFISIHRWTARQQVQSAKMEIRDDHGEMQEITVGAVDSQLFASLTGQTASEVTPASIDENSTPVKTIQEPKKRKNRRITNPCWVLDDYHLFKKIDLNARAIENTINRYTAGDFRKGDHLVSMGSIGKLLAELTTLRDQRLALVEQLIEGWDSYKAWISEKHPEHQEQLLSKLPSPLTLRDKFDVEWNFRPLTPISAETLDLNNLSPADKLRVIEQSNEMLKNATSQQVESLLETVWGEVIEVCEKINDGSLESGKRKSGALDEILNLLERVQHFSDFASPQVLGQVKNAQAIVKKCTISQLNNDPDVQKAIKAAMAPLAASLKTLQELNAPGTGKADRSIKL